MNQSESDAVVNVEVDPSKLLEAIPTESAKKFVFFTCFKYFFASKQAIKLINARKIYNLLLLSRDYFANFVKYFDQKSAKF